MKNLYLFICNNMPLRCINADFKNMFQRIWVFATNSDILIPLSLQPNGVNLWYFRLFEFIVLEAYEIEL